MSAVIVTPHLGMYLPTGFLVSNETFRLRPVAWVALGGRIAMSLTGWLTAEGAVTWSPNLIAQSDVKESIDLEGGAVFSAHGCVCTTA